MRNNVTKTASIILMSHTPSPVGNLHLASVDDRLYFLAFEKKGYREEMYAYLGRHIGSFDVKPDKGKHARFHRELDRYFSGKLTRFNLKTHLLGTEFQLQVWTALRTIPFGTTTTYKGLASLIGNPEAMRAVGGAVAKNPLPIIIPCHRVIGEGGGLVGFGGGIERKKKLLRHEGALLV